MYCYKLNFSGLNLNYKMLWKKNNNKLKKKLSYWMIQQYYYEKKLDVGHLRWSLERVIGQQVN